MQGNTDPIRIQMLGGFSISANGRSLGENTKKAPKFWRLIQYLIIFRNRPVSNEEIISAIWTENEQADPSNAMRNLVFRMRSFLAESDIVPGQELLLYRGNGYCWNNELPCVVDCEEFERMYKHSCEEGITRREKIKRLTQTAELYKGDFLSSTDFDVWVVPLKAYYRATYFECVYSLLELLSEEMRFAESEIVCKRALYFDQFDEKLHEYHLKALIGQGKKTAALEEYQKMTAVFFDELGVSPSKNMNSIYVNALKESEGEAHTLRELMQGWAVTDDQAGAYMCDYWTFQTVFKIESRSIIRTGKSVYIASFEIESGQGGNANKSMVMHFLGKLIQASFRKGDIFTRSARSQYIVMFYNLTYEDCARLCKRIQRQYKQRYRGLGLKVSIQPLDPV
jgi:DNA-binding SARP family transcriptional activator